MIGRFIRLLNHPVARVIYFVSALVGVPTMLDALPVWAVWFATIPDPVAWFLGVGGTLLVIWSLITNRQKLVDGTVRLSSAAKVSFAEFKRTMWPPPPPPVDTQQQEETRDEERWEVLEHSLRGIGLIAGEAFPALLGIARAKELEGDRYLYLCLFLHDDQTHLEFRVKPTGDQILRRHAIVKVEGEVISNMAFMPCYTSIVSDGRRRDDIKEGNLHLLERLGDGVLSVSVTDQVFSNGVTRRYERDVLRVSMRGYREAANQLRAKGMGLQGSFWMGGYRPPEFNQNLDAEKIDRGMREILDEESYGKWRGKMQEYFKSH